MAYNNVYRQLHGEIMGESEKAIKLEFCIAGKDQDSGLAEPTYKTEWFPISQIQSIHRLSKPDNDLCDILMVSEWVLKQKGILHLAGSTSKPVLSAATVPASAHPPVPSTPPAPSFVDMDDDIPF